MSNTCNAFSNLKPPRDTYGMGEPFRCNSVVTGIFSPALSIRCSLAPKISPAIMARLACSREVNSPCCTAKTSTRSFSIPMFAPMFL